MKLRSKMMFSSLLIVSLIAVTGGIGLYFISQIESGVSTISEEAMPLVNTANKLVVGSKIYEMSIAKAILSEDIDTLDKSIGNSTQLKKTLEKELSDFVTAAKAAKVKIDIQGVENNISELVSQGAGMLAAQKEQLLASKNLAVIIEEQNKTLNQKRSVLKDIARECEESINEAEENGRVGIDDDDVSKADLGKILSDALSAKYPALKGCYTLLRYTDDIENGIKIIALANDEKAVDSASVRISKFVKKGKSLIRRIKSRMPSEDAGKGIISVDKDLESILNTSAKLSETKQKLIKTAEVVIVSSGKLSAISKKCEINMSEVAAFAAVLAEEESNSAGISVRNANNYIALLVGAGLIFGIIMSVISAKSITTPVVKAVEVSQSIADGYLNDFTAKERNDELGQLFTAQKKMLESLKSRAGLAGTIADGDLTAVVKVQSDGDILGKALEKMVTSLNSIVTDINNATDQVNSEATLISTAAQTLSQGATETASSVEEITSSMAEIGSQAKHNAENASTANQLAVNARDAAEKGSSSMTAMTEAMTDINDSSQEISKIIKVIDDIAFQTNLLALNAAVEAARAGRHGKGFAVVAEEVRNLAGRSAKAAQETSELIATSVANVKNGSQIADQTSEALKEIVNGITKAADIVGEISSASNEQAQGVSQVSQGLQQIDTITQQNTANAEETSSSAEVLSSQALTLRDLISKFTIKASSNSTEQIPSIALNTQEKIPESLPEPSPDSWGGVPATAQRDNVIDPKSQIKLDDDEFGKY
jgi:methyl-accepting chemotaxis protein